MAKKKSAAERNRALESGQETTSPATSGPSEDPHAGADEAAVGVTLAAQDLSQPLGLVDHESPAGGVTSDAAAESPATSPAGHEVGHRQSRRGSIAALAEADEESSSPPAVTLPTAARSREAFVCVPLGIAPEGYAPQHLEVRLYDDPVAGQNIKELLAGLVERGVKLLPTHRHPFGKPVSTYADALKWFLQNISSQQSTASKAA